jgi:hypothetical protein
MHKSVIVLSLCLFAFPKIQAQESPLPVENGFPTVTTEPAATATVAVPQQQVGSVQNYEPPEILKKALESRPSGVRLGVALAVVGGDVSGDGVGGAYPRPVAFPYLSMHLQRGIVTDAYCEARKYGPEYAREVAWEFAERLRTTPEYDDLEWEKDSPGACHTWWPFNIVGLYIGMAVPHSTLVTQGGRATATSVPVLASLGFSIQFSDYISAMLGPTFTMTEFTRADESQYWRPGLGYLFGIGGSLDLGTSIFR